MYDFDIFTEVLLFSLLFLDRLTENYITREGVESLIQALQVNTHVKSVWCVNGAFRSPVLLFLLSKIVL